MMKQLQMTMKIQTLKLIINKQTIKIELKMTVIQKVHPYNKAIDNKKV